MQKSCQQCAQPFEVTDEDLKFYDKVSPVYGGKKYQIPAPTLCADCRSKRRLAFYNERKLYNRKCDQCEKEIISVFEPGKKNIYCSGCWWSDKWESLQYGQSYDPGRSFFDQFGELLDKVPRIALVNNKSENSDYCNHADINKNCYLLFAANYCEDCYYGYFVTNSKNCVDTLWSVESQFCY